MQLHPELRHVPVLLDGAQSAVHRPVDVRALDCDFFVFTGHKVYGPSGIGALYGRYDLLAAMPPFNGGGEMIRDVFEDRVTYGDPPHRFEAGTPPIVQAIGRKLDEAQAQMMQQAAGPLADAVTVKVELVELVEHDEGRR